MAVLVDGTVYTVVGSQDFIDLKVLDADGVTSRSLAGRTNLHVRLINTVDNTTIIFTEGPKLEVTDEDEGELRIKQAADEYSQEGNYKYYVDIVDSIGSHPVPMREDLWPKWIVAPRIT
jgi:hypothetical protein